MPSYPAFLRRKPFVRQQTAIHSSSEGLSQRVSRAVTTGQDASGVRFPDPAWE
jgi:hypothetical protein